MGSATCDLTTMLVRFFPPALLLCSALSAIAAEDSDAVFARAEQMQEQGQTLREVATNRFLHQEAACYAKFFVNACLDKAHEERIDILNKARELQIAGKKLELEEKRRLAAERGADVHVQPRPLPTPTVIPESTPDPEALRIRAERQRALERARVEQAREEAERAERESNSTDGN